MLLSLLMGSPHHWSPQTDPEEAPQPGVSPVTIGASSISQFFLLSSVGSLAMFAAMRVSGEPIMMKRKGASAEADARYLRWTCCRGLLLSIALSLIVKLKLEMRRAKFKVARPYAIGGRIDRLWNGDVFRR